eukprot:10547441-Lingulodinium_polyedra.AAC.2
MAAGEGFQPLFGIVRLLSSGTALEYCGFTVAPSPLVAHLPSDHPAVMQEDTYAAMMGEVVVQLLKHRVRCLCPIAGPGHQGPVPEAAAQVAGGSAAG